ncbi:hypothetical protein NJL88_35430 [Streptomyces sp. DK15]|uniref:hypothetical protein n=1 Tax=Streptomyces sp. DK15 TaxID=2957499 RepID=UPI0029B3C2A9|nr:hypothetical protein [Streptomyces sp. DK15]MDX2395257.1 hypothetical protein [Streptomyces sp. DK15]
MSASALVDLDSRLDSGDASAALAAVWDVLDLVAELCDRITFDEGCDELQAMIAAQKCVEARDFLPLPTSGEPVAPSTPAPGAAGLAPYAHLLERVSETLTRLSADSLDVDPTSLRRGAELSAGAAAATTRIREA